MPKFNPKVHPTHIFLFRLLYSSNHHLRIEEVLPFLQNTSFFGNETFHLPEGRQARRIPFINPNDSRSEEGKEEEMRQRLGEFMNPSTSEDPDIFSLSVPSDCRPLIREQMAPFVLYFSGTFL